MTAEAASEIPARRSGAVRYEVSFPSAADSGLHQDEEWCEVRLPDGEARRIRFHDYDEIYPLPGLYEQIFYEALACSSPATVVGLLARCLDAEGVDAATLTVLDLGAGNGMVGEELARIRAGALVGVDIIEQAGAAAARDRPGLYDEYLVEDLTAPSPDAVQRLRARSFDVLVCVAALGFGDIPPLAFAAAYDQIAPDGWLAFNIRDEFLERGGSGFAELIRGLRAAGCIEVLDTERYVHRLASVDGEPLHYVAIVARKRSAASACERIASAGS